MYSGRKGITTVKPANPMKPVAVATNTLRRRWASVSEGARLVVASSGDWSGSLSIPSLRAERAKRHSQQTKALPIALAGPLAAQKRIFTAGPGYTWMLSMNRIR